MYCTFKKLLLDEAGATAVEYGLIAALVSVAAVTALTDVGTNLTNMFNGLSTDVAGAVAP